MSSNLGINKQIRCLLTSVFVSSYLFSNCEKEPIIFYLNRTFTDAYQYRNSLKRSTEICILSKILVERNTIEIVCLYGGIKAENLFVNLCQL